jgi:hypothetical protein
MQAAGIEPAQDFHRCTDVLRVLERVLAGGFLELRVVRVDPADSETPEGKRRLAGRTRSQGPVRATMRASHVPARIEPAQDS